MNNDKPIFLRMEEAKTELASVINRQRKENGLPFYFLEMILKDLYQQVANGKNAELEAVKKDYAATETDGEQEG